MSNLRKNDRLCNSPLKIPPFHNGDSVTITPKPPQRHGFAIQRATESIWRMVPVFKIARRATVSLPVIGEAA